jgi:hypothetical protein
MRDREGFDGPGPGQDPPERVAITVITGSRTPFGAHPAGPIVRALAAWWGGAAASGGGDRRIRV